MAGSTQRGDRIMHTDGFRCRAVLPLVAALALAGSASASDLRIGLQGGGNFPRLDSADYSRMQQVTRPIAGLDIEVRLAPHASIVLRPGLVAKGWRGWMRWWSDEGEYYRVGWGTHSLRYLELPVGLRWRLRSDGPNAYVVAAATMGLLLSAKYHDRDRVLSEDAKGRLNDLDVGLMGGLGLSVPVGRVNAFVEGAYAWALTNVFTEGGYYSWHGSDPASGRLHGFRLTAGVALDVR